MEIVKSGNSTKIKCNCNCGECGCEFIAEHDEIIKRKRDGVCPSRVTVAVCPECRYETFNCREIN